MVDNSVAITTSTLYDLDSEEGRVRSRIAKKMIENSVLDGYPVFVVDGGSTEDFVRDISSLGARVSIQEKTGMGNARRQAIRMAYESPENYLIFLGIEPEKDFAGQGLLERILEPLKSGKADVVTPVRTLKSLASMPSIQRSTEIAGNIFFEGLSGLRIDPWFGVRAWVRNLTPGILEYNKGGLKDGEDTYSPLHVPVIIKPYFEGRKILPVPVDFIYPKNQVVLEEGSPEYNRKRIIQLFEISEFLERAWKRYSGASS